MGGACGEGEGYVDAAGFAAEVFATACGDDDELAAVDGIGGGGGVAGERERRFPKQLAGGLIEGAELLVVVGGADEKKAAGGDDWPAIVLGAGVFHALSWEFGVFTERNLPDVFAGVQIDGVERAPRGLDGGVTIGIEKAFVAREVVLHRGGQRSDGGEFLVLAGFEELGDGVDLFIGKIGEGGSATLPFLNGRGDLTSRHLIRDSD